VEEDLLVIPDSEASTVARLIQHSSAMRLDKNTGDLIFEHYGS
jgi:hypothetical protein